MKKSIGIVFCLLLIFSALVLASCSDDGIEQINWTKYDELIDEVKSETDPAKREILLHMAEDMLMQTECVVPLYNYRDAYLVSDRLHGVYSTGFGAKYFMYSSVDGKSYATVDLGETPVSFDPAFAESIADITAVVNMFSGLYTRDKDGKAVPDMAKGCEVSEDGLTYTFMLRDSLKWSDGSKLTAADFIYSWKRIADGKTGSPYAYLLDIVARDEEGKIMASTDDTGIMLTVTLKNPCDYFLDIVSTPALYPVKETMVEYASGYMDVYGNILDPDAWTKYARFATSGAYYCYARSDSEIVLEHNDYYHNRENVTMESLKLALVSDKDAAYSLYRSGDIDFLGNVTDVSDELAGSQQYHIDDIDGVYYLSFNYNSDIFDGMTLADAERLRRAISLYIDRDAIAALIGHGETSAESMIPESFPDGCGDLFRKNDMTYRYKSMASRGYFSSFAYENRREALEIIKSLGYDADEDGVLDSGRQMVLTYLTVKTNENVRVAQSIQQDLFELGIILKVNAVPEHVFEYEQRIFNYDMICSRAVAYYDDPLAMLEYWTVDSPNNYTGLGKVIVEEDENAY